MLPSVIGSAEGASVSSAGLPGAGFQRTRDLFLSSQRWRIIELLGSLWPPFL
jgi:hypothetical protein